MLAKARKSGDSSGEVTPVPISNTVVKFSSADDTWREAAWKSRTLPVFSLKKGVLRNAVRFFSFFVSHKTYSSIKFTKAYSCIKNIQLYAFCIFKRRSKGGNI